MTNDIPRIAFFPDSYLEVNGAAMTCRRLVGFAAERGYPFLCVYADKIESLTNEGSVTNLALKRSPLAIPMDEGLKYDPLFNRHLKKVEKALKEFKPDVIHLTGLNDISIIAAILSNKMKIPMLGSWHTNLHEFASRRLERFLWFVPEKLRTNIARIAENKIFQGAKLYYKMPKMVLAPNQELVDAISTSTGRPAGIMARGVDTRTFSPAKRTVSDGKFRLGFVGRLRAEKNVRLLADLEKQLLAAGYSDFEFLIVGDGSEREWLEKSMTTAVFPGFLDGEKLAEAYANMDVFVFPSETDTFGNVAQEAMASGVPVIVSDQGGPKFVIADGKTGFVAKNSQDFAKFAMDLMDNPEKLTKMKGSSREFVAAKSWDAVFEGVYDAYRQVLEIAREQEKRG
jgi:phosphatidylinositol alpha 1,6-mannosyltransferase